MRPRFLAWPAIPPIAAAILVFAATGAGAQDTVPVSRLNEFTHIHGLAVDHADPTRLLIATHHGFYVADASGRATLISKDRHDFMGFTAHPTQPATLYASGHPEPGGNLGVVKSEDGGRNWTAIARGADGPVDFHQMDASKADPKAMYGVFAGLQASRDGGLTWTKRDGLPEGVIDLAASALDADTLYAATQHGLMASRDGGRTWRAAHPSRNAASMVETEAGGRLYAFIVGVGLIVAQEPGLDWATLAGDAGGYVIHLAIDPTDPKKLYAATHQGAVLASNDGGRTWTPFGGR